MNYTDDEIDNLAKRLWSQSEECGACILWFGPKAGQRGYGVISFQAKQVYIHRLIYQLHNPEAILDVVRHTCDTPNCWNIDHLINGTTADNVQDKVNKLRHVFGENNYNTKLKDQDIRDIRASNDTQEAIATKYGINRATIGYIKAGKTWKHVK